MTCQRRRSAFTGAAEIVQACAASVTEDGSDDSLGATFLNSTSVREVLVDVGPTADR